MRSPTCCLWPPGAISRSSRVIAPLLRCRSLRRRITGRKAVSRSSQLRTTTRLSSPSRTWSRGPVAGPLRLRGLGGLAPSPAVAGELPTFPLSRAAAAEVSPCHAGIAWPRTHLAATCAGPVGRSLRGGPTLGCSHGDNSAPKRCNTSGRYNKKVPCETL